MPSPTIHLLLEIDIWTIQPLKLTFIHQVIQAQVFDPSSHHCTWKDTDYESANITLSLVRILLIYQRAWADIRLKSCDWLSIWPLKSCFVHFYWDEDILALLLQLFPDTNLIHLFLNHSWPWIFKLILKLILKSFVQRDFRDFSWNNLRILYFSPYLLHWV